MRDVIEIETERLRLRPLRMSDAGRVARFAGDPGVARMILRAPTPYLECAAEGWIMTLNARAPLGADFVFAADVEGEGLVGVIGAHKRGDESFEVGYWFGRPYWGQGYATEALRGFVGRRARGRTMAFSISAINRSRAAARFCACVRCVLLSMSSCPSVVIRVPPRAISRAFASGGNGDALTLYRSSTAVATLLTFWPPGPEARTKRSSIRCSSRSMAVRRKEG